MHQDHAAECHSDFWRGCLGNLLGSFYWPQFAQTLLSFWGKGKANHCAKVAIEICSGGVLSSFHGAGPGFVFKIEFSILIWAI